VWLTASTLALEEDRARSPRAPPLLESAALCGLEKCLMNARVKSKVMPDNPEDA